VPYHEAVGSLMYAALGTRPDIAYAVQTVSRFSSKPGLDHWEAVKRIFRYLKGTRELWLAYGGEEKDLLGYADADGNMAEDRHAISGYAFILHGGAVSWSAKRQEIVSLSTTESEYVAATHAAKEALWLRSLLSQLFSMELEPTTLFFGQPVSYCTHEGPPISRSHQTHRHLFPFYSLDCRKRLFTAHLLPYERHGRRRSHKGPAFPESQTLHEGTRARISLKGSVRFRPTTYSEPLCSCYHLISVCFPFGISRSSYSIQYVIHMVSAHRKPLYLTFSYLYSMYLPRLPSVVCLPNR